MTTPSYGTDSRTYLDLGNGPDLDPSLAIIGSPQIVMGEEIIRNLMMPLGWLPYAPNNGFDLRNLINSVVDGTNNAQAVESAIQQQVLLDSRILSAGVLVTVDGYAATISIQGTGTGGPFTTVFTLSQTTGIEILSF